MAARGMMEFGAYGYPYFGRRYGVAAPYGGGARGAQFARMSGEPMYGWHGGMLAWLGSGVRAAMGWMGDQIQQRGSRVAYRSDELARALRGRGEHMAEALEERGAQAESLGGGQAHPSRSYHRPDDRVLDDVYACVASAPIDAEDLEVVVSDGVVTLSGHVPTRFEKRFTEDLAEQVFGVREVHNHLQLARPAGKTPERAPREPPGGDGQRAAQPQPQA